MARLRFSPTPADFVIGLGAQTELLDADEQSLDPQRFGRAAAVPLDSDTFQVYLDEDLNDHTTDLLDAAGDPITAVVSSDEFETLGRLVTFQGPEDHFGPLFLSADGVTAYRVEPDSAFLWQLVNNVVNLIASGLTTNNLTDWSNDGRSDGDVPRWNESLGVWEADTPAGTGTVTSVAGVGPDGGGNVPTGELRTALGVATAADMTVLKTRGYVLCKHTGSGYEPKPSGFTYAIRVGEPEPVSNVVDYDLWLKPDPS